MNTTYPNYGINMICIKLLTHTRVHKWADDFCVLSALLVEHSENFLALLTFQRCCGGSRLKNFYFHFTLMADE